MTLAVLYLFAGAERQADFNLALRTAVDELRSGEEDVEVRVEMVDILRGGAAHDLLDTARQDSFLSRIDAGAFDVVIATPPCNTFSRALFNRLPGPRPRRDAQWPWGFPWLSPSDRAVVRVANSLLSFSIDCLGRAAKVQHADWRFTRGLLEHPEDLGSADKGDPASVWQLDCVRALERLHYCRGAIFQCAVADTDYQKPTGLLTSIPDLHQDAAFHRGWPHFCPDAARRVYDGPLPRHCGHRHPPLQGLDERGKFITSQTAAYPWQMLLWLARPMVADFLRRWRAARTSSTGAPSGGGSQLGQEDPTGGSGPPSGGRPRAATPLIPDGELGEQLPGGDVPRSSGGDEPFQSEVPDAPPISMPTRHHIREIDDIRAPDVVYCGRSHARLGLQRSELANWPAKDQGVQDDRVAAVQAFRRWLSHDSQASLRLSLLGRLNGKRLVCHCARHQDCHVDCLIEEFRRQVLQRYPEYDVPWDHEIRAKARERRLDKGFRHVMEADLIIEGVPEPLSVRTSDGPSAITDGGGICSWGRSPPESRPEPTGLLGEVRDILEGISLSAAGGERECAGLLKRLIDPSGGQLFGDDDVVEAERKITDAALRHGFTVVEDSSDRKQPVKVRLLQALLRGADDPDSAVMEVIAQGVPIGVGTELPRTPAVFAEKTKWALREQRPEYVPQEGCWDSITPKERDNYSSAKEFAGEVEELLEETVTKGQAFKLTLEEARLRFGNRLNIASLGAQVKARDSEGRATLRLLYDGTHGIDVNKRIRVRDAIPFPRARDIRRVLRAAADSGQPAFHVKLDVKDAHKAIQVREEDWPYQCCRASTDGDVFVNTCGTYGIASAAYWWGRLAAAIHRVAVRTIVGKGLLLWLMLFADDWWAMALGKRFGTSVIMFTLLLQVLGVPISWKKAGGGRSLEWVGYEICTRGEWTLGISVSRAAWLLGWYDRVLKDGVVVIREFEEALGRMGFVYGAIEYDQPFLGPLYKFVSVHDRSSAVALPLFVRSILSWLRAKLSSRRSSTVREVHRRGALFRVDAKASAGQVSIGGWETLPTTPGAKPRKSDARWFAVEVTPDVAPWVFSKGAPFKSISALELLAATVGVAVFGPDLGEGCEACFVASFFTDSQVSARVVQKHMSTKFPLYIVAMEMSAQLEARGARLLAEWAPRELNQEADDLTNGIFEGFDPAKRLASGWGDLDFLVLDRLLDEASAFQEDIRNAAPRRRGGSDEPQASKRAKLREREPW